MRLIDADALKCELFKLMYRTLEYEDNLDEVVPLIDNAPTIIWCSETSEGLPLMDLRPRQQGEWIFKKFDEKTGIPNSDWCPFCGMVKAQVYDNFCGNCGADMRGGAEE